MNRSPEAWRRIVRISGVLGLVLVVAGYIALQEPSRSFRTPGLLSFYGGFALVIATIVIWYRKVPPRPPVEEEPELPDDSLDDIERF